VVCDAALDLQGLGAPSCQVATRASGRSRSPASPSALSRDAARRAPVP